MYNTLNISLYQEKTLKKQVLNITIIHLRHEFSNKKGVEFLLKFYSINGTFNLF